MPNPTPMTAEQELQQMRRLAQSELRRYRDHEDWEDIVQEAWLESWRQWQRLRGEYALSTVVKVCARSAWSSWIRSRKGRRQLRPPGRKEAPQWSFLEELAMTEWPESRDPCLQVIHRIGSEQEVEIALAAMTDRQRQAVRGAILGEATYQRTAEVMGITTKTAWTLVQYGLRNARRALKVP